MSLPSNQQQKSPPKQAWLQLGKAGEEYAASYLQKKGFSIIARNFKARYGELDIIAQKNTQLVFVEVKTRTDERFGKPEEGVTAHKLREVQKTSEYYLLLHPPGKLSYRIDVIGIEMDAGGGVIYFNHWENVTM